MHILFINQFYKPDVAATGQLLGDLAEDLVQRGHAVHVICGRSHYNGGTLGPVGASQVDGVWVHRVRTIGFGRRRLLGRAIDYLSFYLSANWRALRLPKADVCVSLTTPPLISLIGLMLSKLKGTKHVIWMMDVYPEIAVAYDVLSERSLLHRLLARINRRLYRNAEAVISLGEVMSRRLEEAGAAAEKIHIVHNWVPGEPGNLPRRIPVGRLDLPHHRTLAEGAM